MKLEVTEPLFNIEPSWFNDAALIVEPSVEFNKVPLLSNTLDTLIAPWLSVSESTNVVMKLAVIEPWFNIEPSWFNVFVVILDSVFEFDQSPLFTSTLLTETSPWFSVVESVNVVILVEVTEPWFNIEPSWFKVTAAREEFSPPFIQLPLFAKTWDTVTSPWLSVSESTNVVISVASIEPWFNIWFSWFKVLAESEEFSPPFIHLPLFANTLDTSTLPWFSVLESANVVISVADTEPRFNILSFWFSVVATIVESAVPFIKFPSFDKTLLTNILPWFSVLESAYVENSVATIEPWFNILSFWFKVAAVKEESVPPFIQLPSFDITLLTLTLPWFSVLEPAKVERLVAVIEPRFNISFSWFKVETVSFEVARLFVHSPLLTNRLLTLTVPRFSVSEPSNVVIFVAVTEPWFNIVASWLIVEAFNTESTVLFIQSPLFANTLLTLTLDWLIVSEPSNVVIFVAVVEPRL